MTDRTLHPELAPSVAPSAGAPPRAGWALFVLALSQLMIVLDGTIVNIALPTAQEDLGFGSDQRQWVITAYALAFAALLLLGGRLTDVLGCRRLFIIGLVGFAVSSVVGGVAANFGMLVVGRTAQGAFGALLAPALGLSGIVYGLSSAESAGWGDPVTIGGLAVGLAILTVFVIVESRTAQPLLPLRVVLERNRGGALLITGVVSLALFSVFLFLTYYLQGVRGYTPLQTRVAFLPLPVAIAITSIVIAPRTLERFGPKTLLVGGPLFAGAALLILSTISLTSNYWFTIVPALLVLGLGMGHVFSASPNVATSNLAANDLGVGSAMVNTTQQVGGAIGTALLSVVATTTVSRYLADHGTSAEAQQLAQLASYHTAYLVAAGILVVLSATTLVLIRNAPRTRTAQPA